MWIRAIIFGVVALAIGYALFWIELKILESRAISDEVLGASSTMRAGQ